MPSLPWFDFGVMNRHYQISPEDRCPIGNRNFSAAERARPRPHRSRPFVLLCMQVMRRGVSAELPFVLSSHGSLHRGVLLPLTEFSREILLDSILDESCVFVFLGFRYFAFVAPLTTPRHQGTYRERHIFGGVRGRAWRRR